MKPTIQNKRRPMIGGLVAGLAAMLSAKRAAKETADEQTKTPSPKQAEELARFYPLYSSGRPGADPKTWGMSTYCQKQRRRRCMKARKSRA
jgi:hypothetical protein